MAETALTAPLRSPLSRVADRLAAATHASGGAIRLAELPFLAQINIRLDAKGAAAEAVGLALDLQLPLQPNTVVRAGELTVLWLGPDEWLLVGPPGARLGHRRLRAAHHAPGLGPSRPGPAGPRLSAGSASEGLRRRTLCPDDAGPRTGRPGRPGRTAGWILGPGALDVRRLSGGLVARRGDGIRLSVLGGSSCHPCGSSPRGSHRAFVPQVSSHASKAGPCDRHG
jgi:hypothetical protein